MYSAKSKGNRHSYSGESKRSSSKCGYTQKVRSEKKSRGNSYYQEKNTSWEYGYNERGSGSTVNRAPDPSMCMNHAMEFVNLDNYIANMFG